MWTAHGSSSGEKSTATCQLSKEQSSDGALYLSPTKHTSRKLAEGMEGGPEPLGKSPTSSRPHSASWQQLLEDAKTVDPGRPAEAATQPKSAEAPSGSLPMDPLAAGLGTAMPLAASRKQEAADQVSTAPAMHSSPNLAQPSPQLQASAASTRLCASAQHSLPEQATRKSTSSGQTGGEVGGHSRKRRRASKGSAAQEAESSQAKQSKLRRRTLAAVAPAHDAHHSNQDQSTSLQAAVGSPGKLIELLPKLLDSDHDTPEAQPAADCQVDEQQAVGSKAQLTSGLPSDLYAIQHHHVSQAAEAQQDPCCARGRDLCSVPALKACNTTPLPAQPAGLTTAKSAATRQNPCDAATTATPTASHAAISSVVVPAPARATARPAYQTQADADAKAMGAKPASTHLTTAVDSATRMFSMSDVDANATKSALQPAGAASAAAESAGADSPAGSQPSPMQRPNSCKRRRVKRRLPGGCNVMPGILPNQPAGTQPGSVQRTVSSRRREKEKQRLAERGVSAYLEKKKQSQKVAKKKARKASKQKKQSCQLVHFVNQHKHAIGSQPEDACSVNLSDDEVDAAPPRVAHQHVSEVAASADEGTSAGALPHSTVDTSTDVQAQGHKPVASAAAPSSVTEPEAATAAAASPAFRLPAAVIAEPAELPQLQWPGMLAPPAAVLVPVSSLSPAGRLPPDLRPEAAHVGPEEASAIREPENAAAASTLPEAAVAVLAQVPQLQGPNVSAHPAAVHAPAAFPQFAGRLPPELQAEAAPTAPEPSRSGAPAGSTSQQLSPVAVAVAEVYSPEQHSWPAQAGQADPDGRLANLSHASQQAAGMSSRLQVPWPPSLALNNNQPLEEARSHEPEQLDPTIQNFGPAANARNSADVDPQHLSEVLAIQLSQLQPQAKPCGVRLDCQGLKLLTMDRDLHWESLARRLKTPVVQASNNSECRLLQDAAVADCKAQAVSGGIPRAPYFTFTSAAKGTATKGCCLADHDDNVYYECDLVVRKCLWLRMFNKQGADAANSALAVRDTFVQLCLMGQRPDGKPGVPSVEDAQEACKHYHAMLQDAYGEEAVLEPHMMPVQVLNISDTAGKEELHNFRLSQKRFIVYQPSKARHEEHAGDSPQPSSPREPAESLPDWDASLARLLKQLEENTSSVTYKQMLKNGDDATAASFNLEDDGWECGRISHSQGNKGKVWTAIRNSLANKPASMSRLYLKDGTFPGELPPGCSAYDEVPGLCCGVDQGANTMFPEAVQSSRAGSVFKQMSVESTGTASFTLFAPIGCKTNITAFHQETKKRRSWNCGTGDFIVQPLSTTQSIRVVERVHAAVLGAHVRSQCMLPLEMYLEEGIPLVCYLRDQPYAQLVETAEQSCHAFLSFSNASAATPALKVSSNAWELRGELASAYLLEQLTHSRRQAGLEAHPPEDDPDSWVETPYAMLMPCDICGPDDPRCNGTWQRPWADEMLGQQSSGEEIEEQGLKANRSSSMQVLLVRAVEKVLDGACGSLKPTAWNALLHQPEAYKVLQEALPALYLLELQSHPTVPAHAFGQVQAATTGSHFSTAYVRLLIKEVQSVLASAGLASAAEQANRLLQACRPCADAQALQQLMQDTVRGSEVFEIFMHILGACDDMVVEYGCDLLKAAITGLHVHAKSVPLAELQKLGLSTVRAHWLLATQFEEHICSSSGAGGWQQRIEALQDTICQSNTCNFKRFLIT